MNGTWEPNGNGLRGLIDRFAAAGPVGCTTHPHSFFGRLTPEEWAIADVQASGSSSAAVWGLGSVRRIDLKPFELQDHSAFVR